MEILRELKLKGVFEISLFRHEDDRGIFVKPWNFSTLNQYGISFEIKEVYWSVSAKGNIRGMHFQIPPHSNEKIISCQNGKVIDVLLDLRRGETTYGHYTNIELSEIKSNALFIPKGIAHGFQSLAHKSQLLYFSSYEYVPESDCGIRWNSFGYKWPLPITKISQRDKEQPLFSKFESSFF